VAASIVGVNRDWGLGGNCIARGQDESMGPDSYSFLDGYFYYIYGNFRDSRRPCSFGRFVISGGGYCRVEFIIGEAIPDSNKAVNRFVSKIYILEGIPMKNLTNLMIKTILVLAVLFILIPIFGKSTWTQTIITGLILVAISYLVGDMWILPKFGNLVAVLADLGLGALVVWSMARALPQFILTTAGVWTIAVVLAAGEWFFHLYLLTTQAPGKNIENP
jgi:hypothetical protein